MAAAFVPRGDHGSDDESTTSSGSSESTSSNLSSETGRRTEELRFFVAKMEEARREAEAKMDQIELERRKVGSDADTSASSARALVS